MRWPVQAHSNFANFFARREIARSPIVSHTDPIPAGSTERRVLSSTLESLWRGYEHVNTVVVQGTTVALAREAGVTGSETIDSSLCFNVLSAPTDGSGGASEWVGFRKLPLPNELLLVGKEIVSVLTSNSDNQYLIPVTDAGGRFRAAAFGEFIYIFR